MGKLAESHRNRAARARAGFARDLILERYGHGFTQAQLATRAGTDQRRISLYETGRALPGFRLLARLDAALAPPPTT